jgi:hypothetical protein
MSMLGAWHPLTRVGQHDVAAAAVQDPRVLLRERFECVYHAI